MKIRTVINENTRGFKIKVNPEESEELQKFLFSIGICWADGRKVIDFKELPYLYIYFNKQITHGYETEYFKEHKNKEITLKEIFDNKQDFINIFFLRSL